MGDLLNAFKPCHLLLAGFLIGSFFEPEVGGSTFLCNVSELVPNYAHSFISKKAGLSIATALNAPNSSFNVFAKLLEVVLRHCKDIYLSLYQGRS
jgi:hypothetical protein